MSRTTLLRNFCQSLGIQLLLRDYVFDQKHKQTFNDEDIMNIYPIVKHLNPQATDAYKLFSSGQAHISHGHFAEGREFINEALNLLNQVYGPLHPDIASCNRLLAHLSYVLGEYQAAIMYQYRATMISERVHGIDSSNIISEYVSRPSRNRVVDTVHPSLLSAISGCTPLPAASSMWRSTACTALDTSLCSVTAISTRKCRISM